MSRFAAYCEWTVTARKCLDGEPPAAHLATFKVCRELINFPLAKAEPSGRVAQFYDVRLTEVEQSKLRDRRKELYRKFKNKVVSAHVAVERIRAPRGPVSRLREPLAHLSAALDLMTELKEYDDENPVHWSEVFPIENAKSNLGPDELWLHFKLESIRPCLVFLVRLLRLVLPDCSHLWNECEASLTRKEWIVQFVLDSPRPLKMPVSLSPPGTNAGPSASTETGGHWRRDEDVEVMG